MLPIRDRLPTRRFPIVNYLLIAANVLVFFGERALLEVGVSPVKLVMAYGLVPYRFMRDPVMHVGDVFTSMFMHDPSGWLHIGGNMLFLWIFGDNVEDAIGSLRYLAFYLLSGIAAAAGQILIDPASTVPMVGASGAIAGVLAAYGSLYPRSPITILNPVLPLWFIFGLFIDLPAWIIILEFFVMNLFSGLTSIGATGSGVAFFAHIGGFVAGLVLIRLFMIGRRPREHERWSQWRPPPRRDQSYPDDFAPRRDPSPIRPDAPRRRSPWDW